MNGCRRIASVACLVGAGRKNERVLMHLFCDGAHRLGLRAAVLRADVEGADAIAAAEEYDAVAMAGARTHAILGVYRECIASGKPVFYVDNGYLRSRWHVNDRPYYRITANAMQCDGRGPGDMERLSRLGVTVHPWQRQEPWRNVLIALQSAWWYEMNGTSAREFCDEAARFVRKRLPYRRVIFREKPATKERLAVADPVPWCELHAVITHSSALACEAIMRGVAGVTLAPTACWSVLDPATYDVESSPGIRDERRVEFASVLAANQWTAEEIGSGTAMRSIVERMEGWALETG